MRILAVLLLLSACAPEANPSPSGKRLLAGEGRDRLCIAGDRIGFIAYGSGDANCSMRGRLDRSGQILTIIPEGDAECRIAAEEAAGTIRLGQGGEACSYYCGPDASFEGKAFADKPAASPAVDFAGDPLC